MKIANDSHFCGNFKVAVLDLHKREWTYFFGVTVVKLIAFVCREKEALNQTDPKV